MQSSIRFISEIEPMLSTKTVVGVPITVDGNTLIPLICVGFGFGGREGNGPKKGAGNGQRWRRLVGG
jgi:uncharacterized spore protein YtfJ